MEGLLEDSLATTTLHLSVTDLQALVKVKSAMYPLMQESAEVMLWRVDAASPALGTWEHDGAPAHSIVLAWNAPSEDAKAAHLNELDATEDAAYAIAIAAVLTLGFRVLGRVHHGSGADFLLIRDGEPENDYYKLEVSGIAREPGNPHGRLAKKTAQLGKGDYDRPGVAVVVRLQNLAVHSARAQDD